MLSGRSAWEKNAAGSRDDQRRFARWRDRVSRCTEDRKCARECVRAIIRGIIRYSINLSGARGAELRCGAARCGVVRCGTLGRGAERCTARPRTPPRAVWHGRNNPAELSRGSPDVKDSTATSLITVVAKSDVKAKTVVRPWRPSRARDREREKRTPGRNVVVHNDGAYRRRKREKERDWVSEWKKEKDGGGVSLALCKQTFWPTSCTLVLVSSLSRATVFYVYHRRSWIALDNMCIQPLLEGSPGYSTFLYEAKLHLDWSLLFNGTLAASRCECILHCTYYHNRYSQSQGR